MNDNKIESVLGAIVTKFDMLLEFIILIKYSFSNIHHFDMKT